MPTVDATIRSQAQKKLANDVIRAQNQVDFTVFPAAAGDTVRALKVPAGAIIKRVDLRVDTPSTNTITVGDSDSASGWFASTNLSQAAGTVILQAMSGGAPTATYPALAGKFYSADTYLTMTNSAVEATAKVTLTAEYGFIP